jgi:dolichol-phosphate mannosyltransferase
MLDRYSGVAGWVGLLEVLLVQALPPWIAAALLLWGTPNSLDRAALAVQGALVLMRVATLIGTRRAYDAPPATYWLSPLADLPVAILLFASALRRRHTWRGRALVPMEAR